MSKFGWIDRLNVEEYIMPFVLEKDTDYRKALENKLDFICIDLENAGAETRFIEKVNTLKKQLIDSLDFYYRGNIWKAHKIINDVIAEIEHKNPAVASINDTYQLWGEGNNVQLFRARLGESMIDYPAEEMLHIPFNLRSRVKTERFSIPGLPCLYLGNTSYSCWVELGAPDDYKFNVSPVIVECEKMILNLAVSVRHIMKWNDTDTDEEHNIDSALEIWLRLLVLTIATSYTIKEKDRDFKSEYIIPQMIMEACIEHDIDGVVYISKKVSEELFGMVVAVNVALFAKYDGEEKFSKICSDIRTADSFNFAMYNKILLGSQKYRKVEHTTHNSPLIRNIASFSRQIPYEETSFYKFDEFLFSSIEMRHILQ